MKTQTTAQLQPLSYNPTFEDLTKHDQETLDDLLKTLAQIRETTYKDTGHAMRSLHVKSQGLLKGEFQVVNNLPDYLAQGLFAQAATYPVLMRLSASPGDQLPDKISTPKGCAIKVLNVPGERLRGREDESTQDFVMVNAFPAFQTDSLKSFGGSLKMLGATTDKMEGVKVAVSTVLRGFEKLIEGFGGSSDMIRTMGGEPEVHILGETYYTQVPFLFGQYMVKFSLVPVSPELTALTGAPLAAGDQPDAIRDAVKAFFTAHGGEWELRAQLCMDKEKMPIEDPTVEWPEELSPYTTVARIKMPPQPAWNEALAKAMDDGMSFSPWHGLAAHRPLGSINWARKFAYDQSAKFRADQYGKTPEEPASIDEAMH